MSVQNKGRTHIFSAAVCALMLSGCAGMVANHGSWQNGDAGYVSSPEADRLGSRAAQQLQDVLAQLPAPKDLPAAPQIDLSLIFDEYALSIDNVLLRWRLADMQLNATRKEMDYLISLVVDDEELQRRFEPGPEEFESLQSKLLQCVQALEQQHYPVQAQMNRVNDKGWNYVKISGHDPDAELEGMGVGGIEGLPLRERDADQLVQAIGQLSVNLSDQAADIRHVERDLAAISAAQPAGKPLDAPITSRFGARSDPFTGRRSVHRGLDLGAPMGTPIRSVAAGRVKYSGTKSGFGRVVEVDHGNGYVTRYAHNSKNVVKKGQLVERGQKLAEVGKSGRSTGPHLHFEVLRSGKAVDPMSFVRAKL